MTEKEERLIRAAILNGYMKYVRKKWGEIGVKEALNYAGLKKTPKDGEWVPLKTTYSILHWIADKYGKEHVPYAGKEMIRNLTGDFRLLFASVIGFDRMLNKVQSFVSKFLFQGNGVEVVKGDHEATIRLKDFRIDDISCLSWKGALMGALEMTKTAGTVEIMDSGNERDCLFHVKWE